MVRRALVLVSALTLSQACADPPQPRVVAPPPRPVAAAPVEEPTPTSDTVPVNADDPMKGPKSAPITIVMFSDFQCPFCRRVGPTIERVLDTYPGKVRVVWKDLPLSFHPHAREAAVIARVVQITRGDEAFWKFHDRVFENQTAMSPESLREWAYALGVDDGVISSHRVEAEARVDRGLAESERLVIKGTPNFLIDGELISGAQPFDKFKAIVDAHLQKAQELAGQGVPQSDLYAKMVEQYFNAPKTETPEPEPPEDTTVWKVEIGSAPTRGSKDALVTIVTFSDFQCPFCKRVEQTFSELEQAYPGKLRFVWKNQPLTFHNRAMPAAIAAREVFKQKGEAAFWKMHDALFASQPKLEDEDLEAAASQIPGVDPKKVLAAVGKAKWRSEIEDDIEQAEALKVGGTPHSFVNGRVVTGAQPLAKFKKIVDEELAKAEEKVKAGTKPDKVYAETIKGGKLPGAVVVLPVPPDAPWKGGAKAKVVVQVFSDFQCPFCRRLSRTSADDSTGQTGALERIEKRYGDKIKIVWRDFPLAFHDRAIPAAVLAREAKKQKGNATFWKVHDELFDSQKSLDDETLKAIAKRHGIDWAKVEAAMAQNGWKDAIDADLKAGGDAGVTGTPAVFVNGKAILGAQPEEAFVKVIDKALAKK
ncbi:MAG: thioredoxin domain-containing protein [Deltaproteobacteria bacterium]|nr:thioredoxin domain-containing protein [Deltaproteobacteria bacterium]